MVTDMSVINLFLNASLVVKIVMLTLLVASILSWAIIMKQSYFLHQMQISILDFENTFWSGIDLGKLYSRASAKINQSLGAETVFIASFKEFVRLHKAIPDKPQVIMQGILRSMRVSTAKQIELLERNLPTLATIQSISPYIGLFGTVWGIMHAFRELGQAQQATVAMVAPGIAEALVATAAGLVAAIPAGVAYNKFVNRSNALANQLQYFSDELANIMHRRIYEYDSIGKEKEDTVANSSILHTEDKENDSTAD